MGGEQGGAAKVCAAGGEEPRSHNEGGIATDDHGDIMSRERCVGAAAVWQ